MPEPTSLERQIIGIVAEALDQDVAAVELHSSLIDDLGAESIDFVDLAFRVETAFGIEIPDDELWRGSFRDGGEPLADRIGELRERMPAFRWDRFPEGVARGDLPRLVTVQTIVDYLKMRGLTAGTAPQGEDAG